MELLTMEEGRIYFIDFGGNTQILGRFMSSDVTHHYFYDLLHYWNGFETFQKGKPYCVHTGIEGIRPASKAEKHALIKFEIENDCI